MTAATPNESKGKATEEWVLRQLPGIAYICKNDEFYTMRFISAGNGQVLGYDIQDFIDSRHYFAVSAVHPDDLDIADAHADAVAANRGAIVARYRLIQADGAEIPMIVSGQAIRDAAGKVLLLAGFGIDISRVPDLQGASGVLSRPLELPARDAPYVDSLPDAFTPRWVLPRLPVVTWAVADDASYTPIYISSNFEGELAYAPAEFESGKGRYRLATVVHPADQVIADQSVELAAAEHGSVVFARIRLLRSDGDEVQALCVTRGVHSSCFPGGRGVVGAAFYLRDVLALQGPSKLLG